MWINQYQHTPLLLLPVHAESPADVYLEFVQGGHDLASDEIFTD